MAVGILLSEFSKNLRGPSFHATLSLAAKVPVRVVADRLGHSSAGSAAFA